MIKERLIVERNSAGGGASVRFKDTPTKVVMAVPSSGRRSSDEQDFASDQELESNKNNQWDGDNQSSFLSQFHEEAILQTGDGWFTTLFLLVNGLCISVDSIESYTIVYMVPSAEQQLCLSDLRKWGLACVSIVGTIIGAFVWGALGDKIGRRTALMSALLVDAIFGFIGAFMPTYALFVVTQTCASFGVGGVIPLVLAYTAEFLGKEHRGKQLSLMVIGWGCGGLLVAFLSWIIWPRTGFNLLGEKQREFSSWRVLVVLCSVPSIISCICLGFLNESPRFLMEAGRDAEAIYVYKKVYKTNRRSEGIVDHEELNLELPREFQHQDSLHAFPISESFSKRCLQTIRTYQDIIWETFRRPKLMITIILIMLWSCYSFSYFSMFSWLPKYLQSMQEVKYDVIENETYANQLFNSSLGNAHFINCKFDNVSFHRVYMDRVTFDRSNFTHCDFHDVRSSRTFFDNAIILMTTFFDTDFHHDRFRDCSILNSSFVSTIEDCPIDFHLNFRLPMVLWETFVGQGATIPGALLTACFIDRIGRVKMIGVSSVLACMCPLLLWLVLATSDMVLPVLAYEACFTFFFVGAWISVMTLSVEFYPTRSRCTSLGMLSALSRVSSLLALLIFGQMVAANKLLPVVTISVVMLFAGFLSIKLEDTRDYF